MRLGKIKKGVFRVNEQKDVLQSISRNFSELLPGDEKTLLLVVYLYQRIQRGDIEDEFMQRDFEDAVDDVATLLQLEQSVQKQVMAKRLSSYFYNTIPRGKEYRIQLTVYAKELSKLLIEQVQPDIKRLELIHTFKRTLPLGDDDLHSIDTFIYWFDNHFYTAKKEIQAHIDNLERTIDDRINDLRLLLKPYIEDAKELVHQYLDIFEELGRQTTGVANTLDFKNEVIYKIQTAKDKFGKVEEEWTRFFRVYSEIDTFFAHIDRRIIVINNKNQIATKRLKTLLDTLRHKQLFKVKIEKTLELLLQTSRNVKGEIQLHQAVPRRRLPVQVTKFFAVPRIDFWIYNNAAPFFPDYNDAYYEAQRVQSLRTLYAQQRTAHWLDQINTQMVSGTEINFDYWFEHILLEERNVDIALAVCHEMIQRQAKQADLSISISNTLYQIPTEGLYLWKMKLQALNS